MRPRSSPRRSTKKHLNYSCRSESPSLPMRTSPSNHSRVRKVSSARCSLLVVMRATVLMFGDANLSRMGP